MPGTWTSLARQLSHVLQQTEARFTLLQKIDAAILSPRVTLDVIVKDVLRDLIAAVDAQRASVYIDSGEEIDLLTSTNPEQRGSLSLPGPSTSAEEQNATEYRTDANDLLLRSLSSPAALIARIYGSDRQPFGYLIVECDAEGAASFGGQDIRDFVAAVAQQLSLAIQFKEERRLEQIRWGIVETILDNFMNPTRGFEIVSRGLSSFLPPFEALRLDPAPELQLLLYAKPDSYLTVEATTGKEGVNTKVLVSNSVCGRLISEDRHLIVTDPREDPLYRPYLGRDMRSELAVRSDLTDQVASIVNLESPTERAFRQQHVQAVVHAIAHMRPILAGLYASRGRTELQQRALASTLGDHLEMLARAFSHDLSNSLAPAKLLLEEISATVADSNHEFKDRTADLGRRIDTIDAQRRQLADDIRGFSQNRPRCVAELIESAILLVWPNRRKLGKLDLAQSLDTTAIVRCSLLLKQVFANLLQNAAYWVGQRALEERDFRGLVEITLTREQRPDATGSIDGGLNEKVRVVVRDNGPGMEPRDLARVFEENFTRRKGGTGYGLFAAKDYVTSIGGEISATSEPRRFFEVVIVVDQYDQRLHARDENPLMRSDDNPQQKQVRPRRVQRISRQ